MKRYESYKNSGVGWIGEIPSHWKVERLQSVASCNDECLSESTLHNQEIEYVEIGNVDNVNGIRLTEKMLFADAPSRARRITKIGDIIVSTVRTYLKAIAVIERDDLIVSTGFAVIRPNHINNKFIQIAMLSDYFINSIVTNSYGVNYPAITANKLIKLYIPIPPHSEQQAIVDYLKDKTLKIEQYVSARERERELLSSLKQSEIANVVTKGLNPNVRMKDSGIPWIGMIPEHWEVSKMRSLFKLAHEKTDTERTDLLSLSQYTGIKYKSECEKTGMFEAESTIGYNVVHKGQFVMNIMLAWNGSYSVSDLEGIISPSYCIFDFKKRCDKRYFNYLLRTEMYQGVFKANSKGLIESRLRLYPNYFFPIGVVIPPLEEQIAIGDYIDNKICKIDNCIADLQAEIDYLKEFKQRLISDVVTGQICVAEPQKGEKQ